MPRELIANLLDIPKIYICIATKHFLCPLLISFLLYFATCKSVVHSHATEMFHHPSKTTRTYMVSLFVCLCVQYAILHGTT